MNKFAAILLAALALVLWQPASAQQVPANAQTLRGADTADTDEAPRDRPYAGQVPGSQKPIARTFSQQPPLIPHAIESFDALTLEQNPCLACNGQKTTRQVKARKMAASHFKDRDGKTLAQVAPARHQCTTCHVPQADAKPLVENTFKADGPLAKKKR